MNYKISHPDKIVKCTIDLPSSKSISNRILIINSLTGNKLKIQNLSSAHDTIYLQNALKKNGIIDMRSCRNSIEIFSIPIYQSKKEKYLF